MLYYYCMLGWLHLTAATLNSRLEEIETVHYLDEYLGNISSLYFEDARQAVVWFMSEQWTGIFLEYLPCPHFVTTPEELQFDKNMLGGFFVFLKIQDVTEFLEKLPRCWFRSRFILVFPTSVEKYFGDLWLLFEQFNSAELVDIVVVLTNDETRTLQVYTFFPNCDLPLSPILVDEWPRVHSEFPSPAMFPQIKTNNLQGCNLRLTTIDLAPDVIVQDTRQASKWSKRMNKKSQMIIKNLDGIEVRLVHALAEKMNFTTTFLLPMDGSNWGYLQDNGTITGVIGDIYYNRSDIGFGHITQHRKVLKLLEYTVTLGVDCYGWGLPLGAGKQPPAWEMLTREFSNLTWTLLFVALLLSAAALWVLPKLLQNSRDKKYYNSPSSVLCYTCNTMITAPVPTRPQSQPLRIFVALWLLYSIVISVAYQAQLGSIVTVPWARVNIRNVEELLKSDLQLLTPWKLQNILKLSSENDPMTRKIIKRFKPTSNVKKSVVQLQNQDQNIAYMLYTRSLEYYASQSGWNFHVMSEGCMGYHHTMMVLRMGSPLLPRLNILIQQFIENGLLNKWVLDFTPRRRSFDKIHSGLSMPHLLGAFMALALGLLISLLILLLELSYYRMKKHQQKYKKTMCK